jgi:hypothetical protein
MRVGSMRDTRENLKHEIGWVKPQLHSEPDLQGSEEWAVRSQGSCSGDRCELKVQDRYGYIVDKRA